ncbi:MAG: NADH-quinone oxidoreductase subunit J [Gammaproteobacteria bacterium]|nr:NADH-quinone oxidoreductase subunit J [Gammaproteobacteria bacterium]
MTALQIIFYILSSFAVFSALMVVASSNPVRGALFLVLTFFCMAGIWLLLHAEFLALILMLVYVGAVMTLFLFVVMMLSVSRLSLKEGFVRFLPINVLIVLLIVGLAIMVLSPERFGLLQMPIPMDKGVDYSNTMSLGMQLYTEYAYPFEIAAVLLLTAIIAAITLTHGDRKKHKSQKISAQIAVRAKDRVRLVKMNSEPKLKPNNSAGQ